MYNFYPNCPNQAKPGLEKILRIMKLITLCIFLAIIHASAATYAQKVTIKEKNITLSAVFDQIKKQTGYDVLYLPKLINPDRTIDANFSNADVQDVMRACLEGQALTFVINEQTIVIRPIENPIKSTGSTRLGNTETTVSGSVKDTLGKPVAGATVRLLPGDRMTITDPNGVFIFSDVLPGHYSLTISFVGFRTLQMNIEVNESTKLNLFDLVLKQTQSTLKDVVINTGYQYIKPEQSTGAISRITTKDYESRISTDFLSGLTNKLPGLMINPNITFSQKLADGTTTTNSLFQIRGLSTISGNQSPLIVIDGFPTELTLDMIDPNEIKSVTILKDAAAATVYGVRASNGVIVIERKQAEQGRTRFAFRSTFGFTPKDNYDRYRWAKDGSDINIEYDKAVYNTSINPGTWNTLLSQGTDGAYLRYPQPVYIMAQQAAGVITPDQANSLYAQLSSYNNATDYSRSFLRDATTQTYNLDMSGGSSKALYYITANYTGNTLEQDNNSNSHFLLSGRTTLNFTNRFSLDLTTDYQESFLNTAPVPDLNSIYPYEHFTDASGSPAAVYTNSPVNPYYNNYLMSQGLLSDLYYPLADLNLISNKTHTISNRITANFNYNIGYGFNLLFGGVYEHSHSDISDLANAGSSIVNQAVDAYATTGSSGPVFNLPNGGYLQDETAVTRTYTVRAQLNYNKILGKDHTINAILGTEMRDVTDQTGSAAYFGYNDQTLVQQPINYLTLFNGGLLSPYNLTGGSLSYNNLFQQAYRDNRFLSGFSNIVYTFRGKYSLTGSARIDQSNLFGTDPKYRYKPLWSVGANWNIDREDFMKNVGWVKALKLRFAYGFDGNVAKLALPQVIAKAGLNYTTSPISNQLQLLSFANSGLRWEQTQNTNLGLDFSLFKNVTGSIDLYQKKSTDLLANGPIDPTLGGSYALINTASILNRGLEINLHADWISTKSLVWNTGLVFSVNTSKVLQVYNSTLTGAQYSYLYTQNSANRAFVQGYPAGAIFTYRYAGLDNTGAPTIYDAAGNKKAFTNQGPPSDVQYSGTSVPSRNAGMSNRIDIGNFYFYAMINYYGGFKVMVPPPVASAVRPLPGSGNFWQHAGDENIPGIMPSLNWQNGLGSQLAYFNNYVVNGDYFTLGDLTASYNIAKLPLLSRAGFSHFDIKLQATNVYTRALNKFNYSMATNSYYKPYLTPTYTIGILTNF